MFLKSLQIQNYGVFDNATFNLATDVDHPLVLVTGNNGAGKTSMLEALRIALHGRRAFDIPISEADYLKVMLSRFRNGNYAIPCSVTLAFDYVDEHVTRGAVVKRMWSLRRQHIAESVTVHVDGAELPTDDGDDLLATILPPEVARYFFFDGERIRELAEWGIEDESALFQAVGDLLGLGVLEQLKLDLARLMDQDSKSKRGSEGNADKLERSRVVAKTAHDELRAAKAKTRRIRGAWDRARSAVKRLGALQSTEIADAQERLGSLLAERKALIEEFERSAHDILPLLCAKTLRQRFSKEINARLRFEEREIVTAFIDKNKAAIKTAIKASRIGGETADKIVAALKELVSGPRVSAVPAFPDISRSEATWMQRIIERELPELSERMQAVQVRMVELGREIEHTEDRLKRAPSGDPAAEAALAELETQQRAFVEHEQQLASLARQAEEADNALDSLEQAARLSRQEAFRAGRLAIRDTMMRNVLNALPALTARMQASKEQRFASYLHSALNELWHKSERLSDVIVSFSERRIELHDANGPLQKADLSAGEKQLFAVAFIYALAQLSGSRMPLVIDTPLGRLDKEHRRRFVAGFLPTASHQVILLSTDTEIVGPLFEDVEPLLASHYELSKYNGGVTAPVALAEPA
jgi:DNA sulfur modification protein DndD